MCTGKSDCIFDCPKDSPKLLGELLEIYWQGLRRPAPFFPNSSWAYAEALMKGKDNPGEDARKCWEGNDYNYGEMQDPYMRRCFPTFDPRGSYEFARIAETVVMPALKRKRGRKKAS
jgi:exodeoxyribonuclease V gamma subunit